MIDDPERNMDDMISRSEQMWKTLSIALITFILGGAIPLFVTRDDVRPSDLGPIHAQLDRIESTQSTNADAIVQLQISVGKITENLKLHEKSETGGRIDP